MPTFCATFLLRTTRPLALLSAALLAFGLASGVAAQQPRVLKISHQFPASTGTDGDSATSSRASSRPMWRSAPTDR